MVQIKGIKPTDKIAIVFPKSDLNVETMRRFGEMVKERLNTKYYRWGNGYKITRVLREGKWYKLNR